MGPPRLDGRGEPGDFGDLDVGAGFVEPPEPAPDPVRVAFCEQLAEELAKDAAVREADTLLLTVPNMLGVDYNARLLETVARHVAPAIGWVPPAER